VGRIENDYDEGFKLDPKMGFFFF